MINREFNNNVRKDIVDIMKDMDTVEEAATAQVSKLETNVSKAKDDISTWADGVGEGIEKWTDDAKGAVANYAKEVSKDVDHGLDQYNSKIQEVADTIPGSFSYKVGRYPWVTISISLVVGLLMGVLLKSLLRHHA